MARETVTVAAFLFHSPAPAGSSTLSLHDALPISMRWTPVRFWPKPELLLTMTVTAMPARRADSSSARWNRRAAPASLRSEEHTSELQSHHEIVCRLLLEKKKETQNLIADASSKLH